MNPQEVSFTLKGVFIPSTFAPYGKEGIYDLVVSRGKIQRVGQGERKEGIEFSGEGLWLLPGVWDLHVHLRDPGEPHKEEISTATLAAVSGGVTAVVAMANTVPPNDSPEITRYILDKTAREGFSRVFPVSAATLGLQGEALAPYFQMKDAGCVAVSDDGMAIASSRVMLRVLEYASSFALPVLVHAEDSELRRGGVVHEGSVSFELGLYGIPREAEILAIARDIELCRRTKAHLHIQHLTTKEGLELVQRARAQGVRVTSEVTPHHLFFSHHHLADFGPRAKVAPPLREPSDVRALREGLAQGIIDCIASDHAPHAPWEKELPWEEAPFGVIGLETLLYAVLKLVEEGVLSRERAFELLIVKPRELLGFRGNPLSPGAPADFFLFDPEEEWVYDARQGYSRSQNSLFSGVRFKGRVLATVVAGVPRYDPKGFFSRDGLKTAPGVPEERIADLCPALP